MDQRVPVGEAICVTSWASAAYFVSGVVLCNRQNNCHTARTELLNSSVYVCEHAAFFQESRRTSAERILSINYKENMQIIISLQKRCSHHWRYKTRLKTVHRSAGMSPLLPSLVPCCDQDGFLSRLWCMNILKYLLCQSSRVQPTKVLLTPKDRTNTSLTCHCLHFNTGYPGLTCEDAAVLRLCNIINQSRFGFWTTGNTKDI